jgi:hypothetical protein
MNLKVLKRTSLKKYLFILKQWKKSITHKMSRTYVLGQGETKP